MDNKYLKEQLDKIGKEVVADIVKQLLDADKKATGNLINSLRYEVLETVDSVLLNIISLDYLENIDKGRRPGAKQPPISSIIPWVQSKGLKVGNKGIESTAFAIAKSISVKGIKPLGIKQKVIDNIINNKTQLISEGFSKDIIEQIDKIIKFK